MDVAIIGAGSLGCLFGGRLAVAGHDVTLLHHRRSYVDALADAGVRLRGRTELSTAVDASAAASDPADLALLLVKTHQTAAAFERHGACVGPETAVLTLQNSFRSYDDLRERFGRRALGGAAFQAAVRHGPGEVEHTVDDEVLVGGPDPEYRRRTAGALDDAGFAVSTADDPESFIWDKQLLGLATKPTAALTRLRTDQLMERADTRRLMATLVAEGERVADARGVDVPDVDRLNRLVTPSGEYHVHRPSMLQDVAAGRPTEIDALTGAIVDYADAAGVDVPHNRTVATLVRGVDRSNRGE